MKSAVNKLKIDKTLFRWMILPLIFLGVLTFLSASLGILPTGEAKFFSILKSHALFVLFVGPFFFFLGTKINYKYYRKYAIPILILAVILMVLVFVPGLGMYSNGGRRWIHLASMTFQPSEFLKFASVVAMSYFTVKFSKKYDKAKYRYLPVLLLSALISILIILQKDIGTLVITLCSVFTVFFIGETKKKDILILLSLAFIAISLLIYFQPYARERALTFWNPAREELGSGWHLKQYYISVGSGGLTGKGLGKSIQKFKYLPEQITDSIFAVYAEEFGFIGSLVLLSLYLAIILRGINISKSVKDKFGKFLAIGLVSILFFQMTLNLITLLGLLTGVPLPLISKGGSSYFMIMFELGVLLNISKYKVNF